MIRGCASAGRLAREAHREFATQTRTISDDKRAALRRGTSLPWRTGSGRIRPDETGAASVATPENRSKAAIPKVGPLVLMGFEFPLGVASSIALDCRRA